MKNWIQQVINKEKKISDKSFRKNFNLLSNDCKIVENSVH